MMMCPTNVMKNGMEFVADMRKGADARTLSAAVLMDCGNILHDTIDINFDLQQKVKICMTFPSFGQKYTLQTRIYEYFVNI